MLKVFSVASGIVLNTCMPLVQDATFSNPYQYGLYSDGTIYVSSSLDKKERESTIAHECGHHILRHVPDYFSEGPYISDYSMVNNHESAAEIFRVIATSRRDAIRYMRIHPGGRKRFNFVKSSILSYE